MHSKLMFDLQFHMFGKWRTVAERIDCDQAIGFMLEVNFTHARLIGMDGKTMYVSTESD